MMKAIFLGSISVLADTSELQREAFNQAFKEAGLDWHWSQDEYREMLTQSGGQDRVADYAKAEGSQIDPQKIHAHKTELFQQMLRETSLNVRPETAKVLATARDTGQKVALVSGTAKDSLDALLTSLGGADTLGISLVTSADLGLAAKPDPALFEYALSEMGLNAEDVQAIEDNKPGFDAAVAAGLSCMVYPNANTALHDFGDAPLLAAHTENLAA